LATAVENAAPGPGVNRPNTDGAIVVDGWRSEPHTGLYAAILLASAGLLMLEISLTRLFSFTIWYHLTYLTISVALLGFGSSGAIVAAFPNLFRERGHGRLVKLLIGGALAVAFALLYCTRFPLDVLQIQTAPFRFSTALLGYYIAVGLPFLLAGFAIGLPFAAYPERMGRLYFWDLLGASLGCLLAVTTIEVLGVPGMVLFAAGLMLAAAAALGIGLGGTRRLRAIAVIGVIAVTWLASAAPLGDRIEIVVTPSKVPPSEAAAKAGQEYFSAWTALNRVDAAGWDAPSTSQYWAGAGLREGYAGPLPGVGSVTYDGCNGSNIYGFDGDFGKFAMLEQHLLRTPYLLTESPKVLVIGVGGGIDMFNAIVQGASHVTGAELQPKTVNLLKERLREFTGGFYDRPDVELLASEGRHFIRKSRDEFDIIQITTVDTFAAQATGAYVLAESYLYTTEAMEDYLGHLTDDGLLSFVVGDLVYKGGIPPPLGTRAALVGLRALARIGAARPSDHLIVLGANNPVDTAVSEEIIIKKQPLSRSDVDTVLAFAEANGFQVLYAPESLTKRRFELSTLLGDDEAARTADLDAAWFRMDAVSDDDPFFYNVGKWSNFGHGASLFYMFPGSSIGQLVLVLMLVQSTLLGAALIVVPLRRGAREGLQGRRVAAYLAYFLALGVGFMFIEISFVQSFVLFLGSPTHALSVTILSLLLFSSFGALTSSRFAGEPERALRRLAPIVVLVVIAYVLGLAKVFDHFLYLEFPWRVAIAVTAQLPVGLTLGMFMPLGVACLTRDQPRMVPWAWGVNGIGSVAGTTLAVVIAMAFGFQVVALIAAALYAVGTTLLVRRA
jgi:hypothetical protein